MSSLKTAGIISSPDQLCISFSPSFYQPETLTQYSAIIPQYSQELIELAAQFNHFPSWILLPEFKTYCLAHLSVSSKKRDFILYAQRRIQVQDTAGAIEVLESCKKFQWPEVFRILARLLVEKDPQKSLMYADLAISLGDSASLKLKAGLLDSGKVQCSDQMSSTKLSLTSQLLARLDPCFSFNVGRSEEIKKTGFISFITSNHLNIRTYSSLHTLFKISGKWHPHPNNVLRELLLSNYQSVCIICLATELLPGSSCQTCNFKVLHKFTNNKNSSNVSRFAL